MNPSNLTQSIKQKAYELGMMHVGISKVAFLEEEAPILEQWLQKEQHGKMAWMENHFDKRLDPRLLVDGARSVISCTYNYFPQQSQQEGSYKISSYAYGKDYHKVFKKKLIALSKWLVDQLGELSIRVFVDSAPVMDKVWAKKSGVGWIGKHTNLINKNNGSYFFIGEIILDVELDYDKPTTDHCGTCTRCLDACPTDALHTPYQIDASKCISYLTIELKDNIPAQFKGMMEDWIFGCDICQVVCPWNSKSEPHLEQKFNPRSEILEYSKKEWEELTEEIFDEIFSGSAVKRAGYSKLKSSIGFIKEKVPPKRD